MRDRSRQGRYHLSDPYFRFFFRFVAPLYEAMKMDLDEALGRIQAELRSFVGQTSFEELCRTWVDQQARAGKLPLVPQVVGSHWSRQVQVDVAAVDWRKKKILLGECKWGPLPVGRQVVRDLIQQKAPRLLHQLPEEGAGWRTHYVVFARAGLTLAAQKELEAHGGFGVNLSRLDRELE
jgi:hypothetical protein